MGRKKSKTNGTKIDDLPDDSDNVADSSELEMMKHILETTKDPHVFDEFKSVFYATALFFLLGMPMTDRVLELALPITESWLILLAIKTVVFFVIFYILYMINKN